MAVPIFIPPEKIQAYGVSSCYVEENKNTTIRLGKALDLLLHEIVLEYFQTRGIVKNLAHGTNSNLGI